MNRFTCGPYFELEYLTQLRISNIEVVATVNRYSHKKIIDTIRQLNNYLIYCFMLLFSIAIA